MNWKKNLFSYIVWVVYTLTVAGGVFGIITLVSNDAGLPFYAGVLYSIALFAVPALLVVFIRLIYCKLLCQWTLTKAWKTGLILSEAVLVVLFLAFGIYLRGLKLPNINPDYRYFDLIKAGSSHFLPQSKHGIVSLYRLLLHGICFLLGNNITICLVTQIVFQVLSAVLLYFAVRKLSGEIPAIGVLGIMMFFSPFMDECMMLSARPFLLLLFAFVLLIISFFINGQENRYWGIPTGLLIGGLAYLDVVGFVLFLLATTFIYYGNERDVKKTLIVLLSSIAGFIAAVFTASLFWQITFRDTLYQWMINFAPKGMSTSGIVVTLEALWNILIFLGALGVGIYSFFCSRKKEGISAWFLCVLFLSLTIFTDMQQPETNGVDITIIMLTVLAGVGIGAIFSRKEPNLPSDIEQSREDGKMQENFEEIIPDENPANEYEADEHAADEPHTDAHNASEEAQQFNVTEKGQGSSEIERLEDIEEIEILETLEETEEEKRQSMVEVKLLENPLPLPKKHQKRQLDYDLDVSDDDDYDI